MYKSETGEWVSFEDYELEISAAIEEVRRIMVELKELFKQSDERDADLTDCKIEINDLKYHIETRDMMLKTKEDELNKLHALNLKNNDKMYKLEHKLALSKIVTWCFYIPTIIGLVSLIGYLT